MQHYKTRHLEALTDIPLGQRYLTKGEKFFATPVDAEYYRQHKQAEDVKPATVFAPPPQQHFAAADGLIKTASTSETIAGDGTSMAMLPAIADALASAAPAPSAAPAAAPAASPPPAAPATTRRRSTKTGAA